MNSVKKGVVCRRGGTWMIFLKGGANQKRGWCSKKGRVETPLRTEAIMQA